MTSWLSEAHLDDFLARCDWSIRHLRQRDREWRKLKPALRSAQSATSKAERAFTFVYLAGALEDMFRALDEHLAADLKRLEIRPHDLRLAAFSLLFPKVWESVSTDRVERLVRRRSLVDSIGAFYAGTEPIDFSQIERLHLTDGRTVNTNHFDALWHGLCLSPNDEVLWPSHAHRNAILMLAEKRNTIAHFNTDPRDEAFRFSYDDLATMAERVKEVVERLREHILEYFDNHEDGRTKVGASAAGA